MTPDATEPDNREKWAESNKRRMMGHPMTPAPQQAPKDTVDALDELYRFVDGLDPDFIIRERISIIKSRVQESRQHTAPDKVLLCYGNYWDCPIDDEECKVSDQCHQKSIRDREERAEAARQAREDVLEILDVELQASKSRIESSAMGKPLSERSRGEIIGLLEAREKIQSLRSTQHPGQEG